MRYHTTPGAPSWADDHDAILTDGHGPLAAFDQPPAPRAKAARPAPAAPSLCRRLYRFAKRLYLERQLHAMGTQLDDIEAELAATATTAHAAAGLHRISPRLNARRRDLRREAAAVGAEMLRVRQELDNLVVQP